MAQAHLLYYLRDAFRLLPVQSYRAACLHGTEATTARADAPQDHKCGCLVAPAFTNIWAARLLADCVQFFATHQLLQIFVVFSFGRAHPEPLRTALWNHSRHIVFLAFVGARLRLLTINRDMPDAFPAPGRDKSGPYATP